MVKKWAEGDPDSHGPAGPGTPVLFSAAGACRRARPDHALGSLQFARRSRPHTASMPHHRAQDPRVTEFPICSTPAANAPTIGCDSGRVEQGSILTRPIAHEQPKRRRAAPGLDTWRVSEAASFARASLADPVWNHFQYSSSISSQSPSGPAGGASDGSALGRGAAGPGRLPVCTTTAAGAFRVIF